MVLEKNKKYADALEKADMAGDKVGQAAPVLRILHENKNQRSLNVAEIASDLNLFQQGVASFDGIEAVCYGAGYLVEGDLAYVDGHSTRYHISSKGLEILSE